MQTKPVKNGQRRLEGLTDRERQRYREEQILTERVRQRQRDRQKTKREVTRRVITSRR